MLPAREVSRYDPSIEIEVRSDIEVDGERNSDGIATIREVKEDADVIIFQRPLDNAFTAAIKQAKKQGIACIVELDDDFANVHPNNHVYKNVQPETEPWSNYEWVQRACAEADLVTVSTPELQKYGYPHWRTRVLPNLIDVKDTEIRPIRNPYGVFPPVVGWSGTRQTHPTDLEVTRPGVAQAVRDTGATFYVVGDGEGVQSALGLPRYVDFAASGWSPLQEYMQRMSNAIDIGIVPLDYTVFNTAKSALKGMEFAALGKPFVASALPEYQYLHDEFGIGLLARTPSEWRKHIRDLVNDEGMREELGATWRTRVVDRLLYTDNAALWAEAWEDAVTFSKLSS